MTLGNKTSSNPVNELSAQELQRYARHLNIEQIGKPGQLKLKNASVLIVGVGGLGSSLATYLAACGVGRIGLVDDDLVAFSNLNRQIVHDTPAIGSPKVDSARQRIKRLNPQVQVETYFERFSSENSLRIANDYNLVLDGSDNIPTRQVINAACVSLSIPYIYAAVYQFEGQVSVFDTRQGPCYQCLFPQSTMVTQQSMPQTDTPGILGAVPGVIGSLEALEALKFLLGIGEPLVGRLLVYDAMQPGMETVTFSKKPDCPVCGKSSSPVA